MTNSVENNKSMRERERGKKEESVSRRSLEIIPHVGPKYSLGGLMLKLELQYFGHLMRRADSLEKIRCWERLKAKGEEGIRG